MRRKVDAVLRIVWGNNPPKRYLPRAYSSAGPGWGIWDTKEARFIERPREIMAIKPDEVLVH